MILLVCGSPRPQGQTSQALRLLEARFQQSGHLTQRVCVGTFDLPIYGLGNGGAAGVRAWRQAVDSASALAIGSPEYHGSFSAGLKNLLDHLDSALVAGKPAALVAASGSPRGGMATLAAMRHVLRSLHVPAIVEQLAVCPQDRDASSGRWSNELLMQADCVAAGLLRQAGHA
ncbi:MAG TPA: NAD(P)H-dependent oxidoreductase [Trinickia sp.]|jgi:NAD(P)H-dependent FMN reductase|uniref:NADPH-dependent FMN reductase n=1 Tax=Trinickia sp. TaxID=2571163 RepID=UPI002F4073ED